MWNWKVYFSLVLVCHQNKLCPPWQQHIFPVTQMSQCPVSCLLSFQLYTIYCQIAFALWYFFLKILLSFWYIPRILAMRSFPKREEFFRVTRGVTAGWCYHLLDVITSWRSPDALKCHLIRQMLRDSSTVLVAWCHYKSSTATADSMMIMSIVDILILHQHCHSTVLKTWYEHAQFEEN